jgi:Na+/melibiose symporter-like transporter
MMTATKAVAGGVAANIVTIVLWGISTIPGWKTMPDEPKAAVLGLISAAIGSAIVYFAPANKETVPVTIPERAVLRGLSIAQK